ncbi:MAG: hypothetical protein ACR2RF_16070 [Geminicoccaceae bacterium]
MAIGLEIFLQANKNYPITKIIWPAVAIVAVISIISTFKLEWPVIILGSIFIVVTLVIFYVVASIAQNPKENEGVLSAATFLVWAFSIILVGFVLLLMSSFFFNWPATFTDLLTFSQKDEVESVSEDVEQGDPSLTPVAVPEPSSTPSEEQDDPELESETSSLPVEERGTVLDGGSQLLQECLSEIDQSTLSISEVESRARECLRHHDQ